MVAAHHLLWTAYGWWLPNDPRGSMSRRIASIAIDELGELHYGRKKIQPAYRDLHAITVTLHEKAAAAPDAKDLPAVPELDAKLLESLGITIEAKDDEKADKDAKPKGEGKSKKK